MNELHFVRNLYCVGYLISSGNQVVKTEKSPNGRTLFFFEKTDELMSAINTFYENEALKKFIGGLVEAKNIMRSQSAPAAESEVADNG